MRHADLVEPAAVQAHDGRTLSRLAHHRRAKLARMVEGVADVRAAEQSPPSVCVLHRQILQRRVAFVRTGVKTSYTWVCFSEYSNFEDLTLPSHINMGCSIPAKTVFGPIINGIKVYYHQTLSTSST